MHDKFINNKGLVYIEPAWPAPATIRALSTTRLGGSSTGVYQSLNLATHVGDSPFHIEENSNILIKSCLLPHKPIWLDQIHSNGCVEYKHDLASNQADACFTNEKNTICGVLTADCVPILVTNIEGSRVCAIHAGWRGLASGVIESSLQALNVSNSEWLAWIGPCIGAQAFAVGAEVFEEFTKHDEQASSAFHQVNTTTWQADLVQLARMRLNKGGIAAVYGGEWCTYSDAKHFYSYRRDGQTGRMATLIWMVQD